MCAAFGVAKSTGYDTSKKIRDLFDLIQFDSRWMLPSLMDQNPFAWMITVDSLMVDACYAPSYIQEVAFRKGLIPSYSILCGMKLSIGQAAKALGVSIPALRGWEKEVKIQPERTPHGHRRYDLAQLRGLKPC